MKLSDHTNNAEGSLCKGEIIVIDFKKVSGDIVYKAALKSAIVDKKPGTEELEIMGTFSHKKEPTMESELVYVGKRGACDVVFVSYLGEGNDAKKKLDSAAKNSEKYTPAFKSGGPKPKARGGKVVNLNNPHYADGNFLQRMMYVLSYFCTNVKLPRVYLMMMRQLRRF